MTALDVADLVVVGEHLLGIGPDAAIARVDVPAAEAALAEARLAGHEPEAALRDRVAVTAAGVGLMHGLLRHPPFPGHESRVAVAAGLQFFSLNGWRADLDPPATAAVVVEALACGQLSQADAAAWLSPRLTLTRAPRLRPARLRVPVPSPRPLPAASAPARSRIVVSAVLTVALGGFALLATACSSGPQAPPAHPAGKPAPPAAEQAYAACLRSHGIRISPAPAAGGPMVITAAAGAGPGSVRFQSAEYACRTDQPLQHVQFVTAGAGQRG